MKTFEFPKATTKRIVEAFNHSYVSEKVSIDDVLALATIQKCYGSKCRIRIFKTYICSKIYALYEDDNTILEFDSEKEAYIFILDLK